RALDRDLRLGRRAPDADGPPRRSGPARHGDLGHRRLDLLRHRRRDDGRSLRLKGRSMPLKAVIFDWAGTMVDFGSRAPVEAFRTLFREFGTEIEEDEARGPMGLNKIDHIRALLAMPRVGAAWAEANGRAPDEAAVEAMFARFRELDREVVARFTEL